MADDFPKNFIPYKADEPAPKLSLMPDISKTGDEGRPSLYTEELGEEICVLISSGKSLRKICHMEGMPDESTIYRWLANPKHSAFRQKYEDARFWQQEHLLEDLFEIADTKDSEESPQRSRIRVDTRKWAMSRLAPKKYGDANHLKISNPEGGPVGIDLKNATDEELDARLAELESKEVE